MASRNAVERFHMHYYNSLVWGNDTYWLGIPTQKLPLDLWIYQEILYEVKPDFIIECGTARGGSALFLASVCELIGNGRIITVDIKDIPDRPRHPRVNYVLGSSTSDDVLRKVRNLQGTGTVMVILDSDHRKEHVLRELRTYAPLVTLGNYLIVEDTSINGHPVLPEFGAGPMEAVKEFLKETDAFIPDRSREKLHLTFNPNGYLRKIR